MTIAMSSCPIYLPFPSSDGVVLDDNVLEVLIDMLRRRLEAGARPWVERAFPDAGRPFDEQRFREAFGGAVRRLGRYALTLDATEEACLADAGVTWSLAAWQLADLGRVVALLVASHRLPEVVFTALLDECHRRGDTGERRAVLRALPLVPYRERFVALAVGACRTRIHLLFEAIACDNPYPAAHFPEPAFNQMVLKALLTGSGLERVVGLQRRVTADLIAAAEQLVRERVESGQPAPCDIALLR